ncbi:MAG TPA: MlaD family protein [Gemmatimonadaceae bacterium]|jgi:phospholipid/cholesterol/gamma-HCH transport system substrate-binding protein
MKRSSFITWDQLKVGGLIVFALLVIGVAVYKLGQAANLFAKRYHLIAFLKEAPALRVGGPVLVAGQVAGVIKDIKFLAPDADTMRNLRLVIAIDEAMREQVRGDSKARVRTQGLLGDKVIDISPGTPKFTPLHDGDTIKVDPSLDYEAVLARAAGAVDDIVALTRDLHRITSGLAAGKGTMGQLLTNPALYNDLEGTLARTNALLGRVQSSRGTLARFLDDPALYDQMVHAVGSVDSLVLAMRSRDGTMGRLLTDTTLYSQAVGVIGSMGGIVQNVDALTKQISAGQGTLGKLMTQDQMYDAMLKLINDFTAMLADIRKDPSRYTRGLVNFRIF